MTRDDLRAALARLGLNKGQLAEALKLGEHGDRTIRRWLQNPGEKGHRPIPGPVEVAISYMLRERG